ncbi:MAG: AEC family transporter [Bariatricus sp.]
MTEILIRAACFVAIIFLGFILREKGFFKKEDFHIISKIVLKITLPAAIISNFSRADISPFMLFISLLGFGGGIVMMIGGALLYAGKDREKRAFAVLNISGYNIGNFAMPFVQSFLGSVGVVATSLFDAGNALICLGGSYGVASMIKYGEGKVSFRLIGEKLLKSLPFDTYLVMTVISLLHIQLPSPITTFTGIIGSSNTFMAMLMIGVGFELSGERSQIKDIVKIIGMRCVLSAVLAAVFFFLLPVGIEYRRALAVLAFSPVASANPPYTAAMKSDFGLSSAVNSVSIIVSMVLMTIVLIAVL